MPGSLAVLRDGNWFCVVVVTRLGSADWEVAVVAAEADEVLAVVSAEVVAAAAATAAAAVVVAAEVVAWAVTLAPKIANNASSLTSPIRLDVRAIHRTINPNRGCIPPTLHPYNDYPDSNERASSKGLMQSTAGPSVVVLARFSLLLSVCESVK